MDHIAQIAGKLADHQLDAMLLASQAGERYAVGFHGEGLVLVTREGAHYSTDSRYIEAARQEVQGAQVELVTRERGHLALAAGYLQEHGLKRVGFESGAVWTPWPGMRGPCPAPWSRLRTCRTACGRPRTERSWPPWRRPSASPTRHFRRF